MAAGRADAVIRPYTAADDKLVRFKVGKSQMEGLGLANKAGLFSPGTVLFISLASYAVIRYMDLWPKPELQGPLGYLSPLPPVACVVVSLLAFFEWFNRPHFEKRTQEALKGPDFPDTAGFYSRSPVSGLWILEFGSTFVGLIAIDASQDTSSSGDRKSRKSSKSNTSSTATIRHFYVEEKYRASGIQKDLLDHVLKIAKQYSIEKIRIQDFSLTPYLSKCLRDVGFVRAGVSGNVGVFGWPVYDAELDAKKIL